MTKQELVARLAKLNDDSDFMAKAKAAETDEALGELFEQAGIGKDDMADYSIILSDDSSDELTEDSLEDVAGGVNLVSVIGGWLIGTGCGMRCPFCGQICGFFPHVCRLMKKRGKR